MTPDESAGGVARERYELREGGSYRFDLERRDFLRVLGIASGGLVVVSSAAWPAAAQESGRRGGGHPLPDDLASWLRVDEHGQVTAYTGKVEIGQNIRTSLAQAIADELRVRLDAVSLVMADTDLTPYDMGTFGSRTTPTMAPILSRMAATARDLLIERAAAAWQLDRTALSAVDGAVHAPDGRTTSYGDLTRGRPIVGTVDESVPLMRADAWKVRGTSPKKVDGRAFVTGAHTFASDISRPGLLIGRVVRPPAIGATARAVDDSAARAMPGVTVVRDDGFIGVVAPTERQAARAAAAVRVDWTTPAGEPTSETIYDYFRPSAPPSTIATSATSGDRVFEASYHIPYIAHVPLEPRAAVAEWTDGRLTVWTGTQRPFGVRSELAQAFHLPETRVRVIVPDLGSAYGGKHTGEAAVEAARLAKAAGRPVKLVYTRAEEFMWAYFRPAGVIDVRAAVDSKGTLTAWQFDNWNSGGSGLNTPYRIPTRHEQFHECDSPLRQGSYRGLAATANHYAREMHIDAVARAIGVDAVTFRLRHLDHPRIEAVLKTVAEKSGWPHASAPGRAMGIACGTEKGSCIATAAEVSRTPDGFRVEKLVAAFECGAIVNPDGLRNQVEGAIVQGLGGALFEAIRFANGRILNGTMAQYRVPRFKDIPPIEIHLINRLDLPSAGAGETPIVCVAPAIGSAVRAFGRVATALPVTLVG
jgi:isoquinoline 1-oxidoreductase